MLNILHISFRSIFGKLLAYIYIFLLITPLFSQEVGGGYQSFYKQENYTQAYKMIKERLSSIYDTRVEDKRIPADYITAKRLEERTDLNKLFRERKQLPFLIEDNPEIHSLHLYAARCLFKLEEFDEALNHYIQSLRFKPLEFGKDDAIFYEIAQVYKKLKLDLPYRQSLERAYSLNPNKVEYSLELGMALYKTEDKKRAIHHIERYMQAEKGKPNDPGLYLIAGNLNEDIGRYLQTVDHYKKYLSLKPEDGHIYFALGYLAYERIGDHKLADESFDKALKLLPQTDIYRRSKANEYKGDIRMKDLEFADAISYYMETLKYQDAIKNEIEQKQQEILKLRNGIKNIKASLLKESNYDKYNEYEISMEERAKKEMEKKEKRYNYEKLNSGRIRWNIADSHERLGQLDIAVKYYRECISFNYNSGDAREKIIKLQLKIIRGY